MIALAAAVAVAAAAGGPPPAPPPDESFRARVVFVSDGDTFGIASKRRGLVYVRIIGLDTPETKHPDRRKQCYGTKAARRLEQLVGGKVVTLAYQRERRDRFGRDLLDVWTPAGRFVAGSMVRQGFGTALRIWPNVDFAPFLARQEQRAQATDAGLWGACTRRGAGADQ